MTNSPATARWQPAHQVTTHLDYLADRETHREPPGEDGLTLIYSTHLPEGAQLGAEVAHREFRGGVEQVGVFPLTLAGGDEVFVVLRTDVPTDEWKRQCGQRGGSDDYDTCTPAREDVRGGGRMYPTVVAALIGAGDEDARAAENQRAIALWQTAKAACEPYTAENGDTCLSRAGYEAACRAVGLEPAPEERIEEMSYALKYGDFGLNMYTVEHSLWIGLTRWRWDGQKDEAHRQDLDALNAATTALGAAGPLTREQYEAGCAAADVQALPDQSMATVLRDIGWELQIDGMADVQLANAITHALGPYPKTARHLADRRLQGLEDELAALRQAERAALPADHEFATGPQVSEIRRLLDQGEGGGWYLGPTDLGGIRNLSKAEASAYINSLRGDY